MHQHGQVIIIMIMYF